MLSKKQKIIKRSFDLFFSIIGILILIVPILVLSFFATLSTKSFGIFLQERIGQYTKPFYIIKIRSMVKSETKNHITLKNDKRITQFGRFLRKYNLDELTQVFNVFLGSMSFVGPRPDVKGYADLLEGEDQIILSVKPGITGPATLKFKHEDEILKKQSNPKAYNDEVIWKEKIEINKNYIKNWSLSSDIKFIFKTIF